MKRFLLFVIYYLSIWTANAQEGTWYEVNPKSWTGSLQSLSRRDIQKYNLKCYKK